MRKLLYFNTFINEELRVLKEPSDDETYDILKKLCEVDVIEKCIENKLSKKFLQIAFDKDVLKISTLEKLLIIFTEKNYLVGVEYVIDKGVNINYKSPNGKTALMYAAMEGFFDIVEYLVEHGADVNIISNDKITTLTFAAMGGDLEIVKYLVEHGADANHKTLPFSVEYSSALNAAIFWKRTDVINYLKNIK